MKFDLQKFADTVTTSQSLQINFGFEDGDTRISNVPNPKIGLTSSEVATVSTWIAANNVLIGDKNGAASTGINSATRVDKTKVNVDIS